ncbi:hypothetical protein [Dethiothermospora halolimnae]|uniref:hypothetical protein n=1 Tax=Dethiothermospora halolimnae TaxID=3114390 RepID=UPI003CCB9CB3
MKVVNNMWWKVKKIYEDDNKIVYAYSYESHKLDGKIECYKKTQEFKCLKLSDEDNENSVQRFYTHLWRLIFKEDAPEEKIIAIG